VASCVTFRGTRSRHLLKVHCLTEATARSDIFIPPPHLCTVLSRRISMKLATNIQPVGGNCGKGFQGQRSKVKVIASPNALLRHRAIAISLYRPSVVRPAEVYRSTVGVVVVRSRRV